MDLNNKSILITGGTGSLGKALTQTILKKWPNIERLIIYSRDTNYLIIDKNLFIHECVI